MIIELSNIRYILPTIPVIGLNFGRMIMLVKRYRVELTSEDRAALKALVSRGRSAAYKQTHACILLMSDEAQDDLPMTHEAVAQALKVPHATVERVRRRCVEEGVEVALNRKKQLRCRAKKLDGDAHLIAIACSEPLQGRASWTLKLLADQLVECDSRSDLNQLSTRKQLFPRLAVFQEEFHFVAQIFTAATSGLDNKSSSPPRLGDSLPLYTRKCDLRLVSSRFSRQHQLNPRSAGSPTRANDNVLSISGWHC